jgi:hypothetical protein
VKIQLFNEGEKMDTSRKFLVIVIAAFTLLSLQSYGVILANTVQFGTVSGTNVKKTLTDCDGNSVMFSLTGGGYGEMNDADCAFSTITLYETTDKSALTILTKGKVYTSVGNIICNKSMKSITAKTATLEGGISIGTSSNPKSAVTLTIDIVDDADIVSLMPVKSISITDLSGSLTAPSAGSITIKGDKKRNIGGGSDTDINVTGDIGAVSIAGTLSNNWDCNTVKSIKAYEADNFHLTLSGKPNTKKPALGSLTVTDWISYSRILSAGSIGSITVVGVWDSTFFAGIADACLVDLNADDVLDLPPILDDTFNESATITSISVKGIKNGPISYFVNSNIAAKNLGSVSIAYPAYYNVGEPFGISTYNDPAAIMIKDANGTHSWKKGHIGDAGDWLLANGQDMQLRRD